MNLLTKSKGYRIRKVYYSDDFGDIICSNFYELYEEEEKFMTGYFRNKKKARLYKSIQ